MVAVPFRPPSTAVDNGVGEIRAAQLHPTRVPGHGSSRPEGTHCKWRRHLTVDFSSGQDPKACLHSAGHGGEASLFLIRSDHQKAKTRIRQTAARDIRLVVQHQKPVQNDAARPEAAAVQPGILLRFFGQSNGCSTIDNPDDCPH